MIVVMTVEVVVDDHGRRRRIEGLYTTVHPEI